TSTAPCWRAPRSGCGTTWRRCGRPAAPRGAWSRWAAARRAGCGRGSSPTSPERSSRCRPRRWAPATATRCSPRWPPEPRSTPIPSEPGFRHEALLYAGQAEFLDGAVPFIRDGLAVDEPILVAVDDTKIRLLRSALDGESDRVRFADMKALGRNPTRIISV